MSKRPSRVLMLIENPRFDRMIKRCLQDECKLESNWGDCDIQEELFDLLLVDRIHLTKHSVQIQKLREDAHPVFLPSLLLLPLKTSRIPNKLPGKTVDDGLIQPFGKDEFNARVKNLLRIRRMSQDLKKKHDQVARLSVTDDGSGFHNSCSLHRHFDRLLAKNAKNKREHSLVFFRYRRL